MDRGQAILTLSGAVARAKALLAYKPMLDAIDEDAWRRELAKDRPAGIIAQALLEGREIPVDDYVAAVRGKASLVTDGEQEGR